MVFEFDGTALDSVGDRRVTVLINVCLSVSIVGLIWPQRDLAGRVNPKRPPSIFLTRNCGKGKGECGLFSPYRSIKP